METLIPLELININNPEIRKFYEKDYNVYYLIINSEIIQNGDIDNYTNKCLLNPQRTYILICNDDKQPIEIIQKNDIDKNEFNKYAKNSKNIWYATYNNIWKFTKLDKLLKRCDECSIYSFEDEEIWNNIQDEQYGNLTICSFCMYYYT
jgi:hypothetical protein